MKLYSNFLAILNKSKLLLVNFDYIKANTYSNILMYEENTEIYLNKQKYFSVTKR